MAATVDALVDELRGMKTFLETLEASGSVDLAATRDALVRSTIAKMHTVHTICFQKGAILTQVITEMANDGVITPDGRNLLTTALINKM